VEQVRNNLCPSFGSATRRGDDYWHDLSRYDTPRTVFLRSAYDRRAATVCRGLVEPENDSGPEAKWWETYLHLNALLTTGMLVGLVGRFGSGKTVMATMLMWDACLHLGVKSVWYCTAARFFRELQASFKSETSTEQGVMNRYVGYDLLVIDEAHERANSDYEDRRLVEVINMRYGRGRDTILITNLSMQEFAGSIGGAVMDRMNQVGGLVDCDWPSFRTRVESQSGGVT